MHPTNPCRLVERGNEIEPAQWAETLERHRDNESGMVAHAPFAFLEPSEVLASAGLGATRQTPTP